MATNRWYHAKMRDRLRLVCAVSFLSFASQSLQAQSPYKPYQPADPPAVGGLPTGSRGLEQPVYIADRSLPRDPDLAASQPIDFSDYRNPDISISSSPNVDFSRFEAATLIAVVGREPILIGDIIDPKKVTSEHINNSAFEAHLRKALADKILKKALAQKFFNDQLSGKTVKERTEIEGKMKAKVTQAFYNDVLPKIMKEQKCDSIDEFCDLLEKQGMSLQSLKESYAESILAQECIRDNVPQKPNISLEDLSDYYQNHLAEFQQPAKARFQILSASFTRYKTKEEADRAIRDMAYQVFYGTPFETVAKASSSGLNAEQGGFFDWTTQGALKSKPIDAAIFSIEPNALSQIITDDQGFHIVRVLERQNAFTIPFHDAQQTIRKKLLEIKRKEAHKQFVEKVKEQTTVWTKWPDDFPGARPLSEIE